MTTNEEKARAEFEAGVLRILEASPLPDNATSDLCDTAGAIYWRNIGDAPKDPYGAFRSGFCAAMALAAHRTASTAAQREAVAWAIINSLTGEVLSVACQVQRPSDDPRWKALYTHPASPATASPEPIPQWQQIQLLVAAAKSGDPEAIKLAAQLADCAPCASCGFVKAHCRCTSATASQEAALTALVANGQELEAASASTDDSTGLASDEQVATMGLNYVHSALRWAASGYVHTPERINHLRNAYRIVDRLVNEAAAASASTEGAAALADEVKRLADKWKTCAFNDMLTSKATFHAAVDRLAALAPTGKLPASRVEGDALTKIADAYGHLWHVNNEPMAPIPMRSPEKAAYEARKILRDMLTTEQRGEAINRIGQALGYYDATHQAAEGAQGGEQPDLGINGSRCGTGGTSGS